MRQNDPAALRIRRIVAGLPEHVRPAAVAYLAGRTLDQLMDMAMVPLVRSVRTASIAANTTSTATFKMECDALIAAVVVNGVQTGGDVRTMLGVAAKRTNGQYVVGSATSYANAGAISNGSVIGEPPTQLPRPELVETSETFDVTCQNHSSASASAVVIVTVFGWLFASVRRG